MRNSFGFLALFGKVFSGRRKIFFNRKLFRNFFQWKTFPKNWIRQRQQSKNFRALRNYIFITFQVMCVYLVYLVFSFLIRCCVCLAYLVANFSIWCDHLQILHHAIQCKVTLVNFLSKSVKMIFWNNVEKRNICIWLSSK